jgi:predicted AlkP superfamily pyrophosphatase or phosphodiesterase
MRHSPSRPGIFTSMMMLGGICAALTFLAVSAQTASDQPAKPKLVVLVVFDQMRGDYLTKWEKLYDKDGFGRLLRDGAWFQNCHYPYAFTLTAPGHASIATGCPPSKHGIIANDWYDRATRVEVGAVKTDRYRTVPQLGAKEKDDGPAPVRLKQSTVGDGLQKMGNGKVVSLSLKDRAAILMAALRATAVYWFNTAGGLFVTSTFYRDPPHSWVNEFNKGRFADKFFAKDWTKLRLELDYEKYSSADDVASEGIGFKQGRIFPHPMTGGLEKPGKNYYDALTLSPYGNGLLLELAKRAIDAEQLGQRDACDLLCLSFSSNDLVGHCWGPDSQEVLDITLRSDLLIKELLAYLDAKVGRDRYVLVMTADHGVSPIPEVAAAQGKDAGRVSPNVFTTQAADVLQTTFAADKKQLPWIEKSSAGWIYLNQATLKEAGVPAAKAEQALVDWLGRQPGIQSGYGRSRLEQGRFADDPIGEAVRLSYHPDCSGDVAVILKPNYLVSGPITEKRNDAYRTTHGTPHPNDTHVAFVVFGAGVQSGVHQEQMTPLAAAAIMAEALGIPPPGGSEYPVPDGLFLRKQ